VKHDLLSVKYVLEVSEMIWRNCIAINSCDGLCLRLLLAYLLLQLLLDSEDGGSAFLRSIYRITRHRPRGQYSLKVSWTFQVPALGPCNQAQWAAVKLVPLHISLASVVTKLVPKLYDFWIGFISVSVCINCHILCYCVKFKKSSQTGILLVCGLSSCLLSIWPFDFKNLVGAS
jgi:hypothetical protein